MRLFRGLRGLLRTPWRRFHYTRLVRVADLLLDPPVESAAAAAEPWVGYVDWIPEHGGRLIDVIAGSTPTLREIGLFRDPTDPEQRRRILHFAEYNPVEYQRRAKQRLAADRAAGMRALLLTLDWPPVMRELVVAARAVGLPTVLVPHESVFAFSDLYYLHGRTEIDAPLADWTLCWGDLQRDIFLERGYPADRLIKVGSPKLDADALYRPRLSSEEFRALHGAGEGERIVLFAVQTMDNFGNARTAREAQAQAVADAVDYCEARAHRLVIRPPPSRAQVFPEPLIERLRASPAVSLADWEVYRTSPEEAMAHADLVMSIGSTMLFEAALMGKASLGLRHVAFDSIWDRAGIPSAATAAELRTEADRLLDGGGGLPEEGMAWAIRSFSDGVHGFDGGSLGRIRERLATAMADPPPPLALDLAIRGRADVAAARVLAVSGGLGRLAPADRLARALGARRIFPAADGWSVAAADACVRLTGETDRRLERLAATLNRPILELDRHEVDRLLAPTEAGSG